MKKPEPIKRTEQLAPLSREHHEALVFLLRLKHGLKNGTSTTVMSAYINWFWTNNLEKHFAQEEALLLPHLDATDEMAMRLTREHQTVRNLISNEMSQANIALFLELLTAHIRFEEREFFPYIEKKISTTQLNDIFGKLDHLTQCEARWEHPFWDHR